MRNRIRRLLISTTMVVGIAPCVAFADIVISTPTGLNPGDQFRIAFVSGDTTTAQNGDIAYYNNLISSELLSSVVTYGGSAVTGKAIVSSQTVNARDNIGLSAGTTPVFLVNGNRVVTDDNLLFFQFGIGLEHAINVQLDNDTVNAGIWTGSDSFGFAVGNPGRYVGASTVRRGNSSDPGSFWISSGDSLSSNFFNIYGLTDVLTVPTEQSVPEPGSLALAGAALGGLAFMKRRRRS